MSELTKLYACLKIAQDDGSDEEVEFWLKEIEREKAKEATMTDDLGREELLEITRDSIEDNRMNLRDLKVHLDISQDEFDERFYKLNQAEQQIIKMIQKPEKRRALIGIEGEMFNEAHKNQPEVTEEWIDNFVEEKAKEAFSNLSLWDNLFPSAGFEKVKDFIRKIVEKIPAKKVMVSEEFVEKWKNHLLHEHNVCQSHNFPAHYKLLLKQMLNEAGVEVVGK